MTTTKELIERLRRIAMLESDNDVYLAENSAEWKAADTIEALSAEVERLNFEIERQRNDYRGSFAERDQLRASFDELAAAVGWTKERCEQTGDSPVDVANQRSAQLEARGEAESLRKALVYLAFAGHATPLHMLPKGVMLLGDDGVVVHVPNGPSVWAGRVPDYEKNRLPTHPAPAAPVVTVKPETNTGHGHVWERPDGMKTRCGGPSICKLCALDAAQLAALHQTKTKGE